jgi:hypothetical protein
MSGKTTRVTPKSKLIMFEYKQRFPQISVELISDIFNVHLTVVKKLFNEGEVIISSKMNK